MSQSPPSQAPGPESFSFDAENSRLDRRIRRKKTPFWMSPVFVSLLLLAGAAGGVYYLYQQQSSAPDARLGDIPRETTIPEGEPFALVLPFDGGTVDYSKLSLSILEGPAGAKIDPETGTFQWTPSEEQGPGQFRVTVQAQSRVDASRKSQRQFLLKVTEVNTPVTIPYIEALTGKEGERLRHLIPYEDPDRPVQNYRFRLVGEVPEGAQIDPESGMFEWYPKNVELNKAYRIEVEVGEVDFPESKATRDFQVTFKAYDPIARFKERLANSGALVEETGHTVQNGFDVEGRSLLVQLETDAPKERVDVFAYSSKDAADAEVKFIKPDLSDFFGKPNVFRQPTRIYRDDRLFVIASDVSPAMHRRLSLNFGVALAAYGNLDSSTPSIASTNPSTTPAAAGTTTNIAAPLQPGDLDETALASLDALYQSKQLLDKKSYKEVRAVFAAQFERTHADVLKSAWADDYDALVAWLEERTELKEEFFVAIDPQHDNLSGALRVMHQLWKRFPREVENYPQLAIAVAVVWDNERTGPYDYTTHQVRTKSSMPETLLDGYQVFEEFVRNENVMQGRTKLIPWEFIKHLVNHRTPSAEQAWARTAYLPKRVMFGQCYSEVPYDDLMLETSSERCALQGQEYNLPNIQKFGGVCAMQADFAARVGKSMGVPAEYVRGEAASGDFHAWVMWVELKNLTPTGINFSLESHGRYNLDKYYVGTLTDPQTGKTITDRELELRLHTVGLDPRAKRQADQAMAAYPALKDKHKFALDTQIEFLKDAIALSPGNEIAWAELARIAGTGNLIKKHERVMRQTLDKLFLTFVNFPDFTWKIFDDLIQYEEKVADQIKLYERLLQLYVQAGRPDLACEARLQMTGYLLDEKRDREAVEGLAATIMAFPDDGRYVPRLLDRLEVLCVDNPLYQKKLIDFYKLFLPKVPQTRGDLVSKYCITMYERGIDRFTRAGETQAAAQYQAQLDQLKAKYIP